MFCLQPFVEEGQSILLAFPKHHLAIAIPALGAVVVLGVTLCTLGAFLVSSELSK